MEIIKYTNFKKDRENETFIFIPELGLKYDLTHKIFFNCQKLPKDTKAERKFEVTLEQRRLLTTMNNARHTLDALEKKCLVLLKNIDILD